VAAARAQAHAEFVRLALPPSLRSSPAVISTSTQRFRRALRSAWRLRCDNRLKQVLWRLAVDAIPGGRVRPWECPGCGSLPASAQPRGHVFWDCPVAAAVVAQLQSGLANGSGGASVQSAAVWLQQCPTQHVNKEAWRVVALAALTAMEYGRGLLWVQARRPGWVPAHGPAVAQAVGRRAAARFWVLLQDFCSGAAPAQWNLPPGHPFFGQQQGRLRVRIPAAAAVVEAL
jgi:hypothetical protein